MSHALFNNVRLHYQHHACHAPDVILVHGFAANLAFWYPRIVALLVPNFRVTTYDLRGHGRSDMPPSGYTTVTMAADLDALLNHLEVTCAHLVGHSYGGAIALHYAVLHPERVASLTLADTRIRAFQPTQRLADWPNAEMWRRMLHELNAASALDDLEMGYRILEVLAEAKIQGRKLPGGIPGSFAPFGISPRANRTAERWLQLLRTTTARRDFASDSGLTLDKIVQFQRPVLATYGAVSNCLPSMRGLQQHLPSCKVMIMPRSGHFHPIVHPSLFVRNLRTFLNDVAA